MGRIGTEIARHLLSRGYRVLGYRRSSLVQFEGIGGVAARSPTHVGEEADIVLSCLPGGDSLDQVVAGTNGLIHSARDGQVAVELGSHPLSAKERQMARLGAKGTVFVDGEVGGTTGMVTERRAPVCIALNQGLIEDFAERSELELARKGNLIGSMRASRFALRARTKVIAYVRQVWGKAVALLRYQINQRVS